MKEGTILEIEQELRRLPPDKLAVVKDFVAFLVERQAEPEAFQTMLASEQVLGRDWESPEEESAWACL